MATRPNTLATLHVALELLKRIPRDSKISAPELQEQLKGAGIERDLRSIQRQLAMLAKHFDIECDDRNRPYGYRWNPGARGLSVQGLNAQESLLLAMAEQTLGNLLPSSLKKSMEGFFTQARGNVGPTANANLEREWLRKVRVVSETQPLLPPPIRKGVFEAVSQALYQNQWLKLNYQNSADKQTEAEVMPLGLAQQGPRIYLVCRFAGYEDERILALHRMHKAVATDKVFLRPADFDLARYASDGKFGFGEGQRIRMKFRVRKDAGRHLLESKLSADQTVSVMKDWYEITATVVDSALLWRWIWGFGKDVTNVTRIEN